MTKTKAYAAQSATAPLAPFEIDRRAPGPDDMQIDILHCGVCHSPEAIPMDYINTAYDRMLKGDVKYRFVVDMASLR